MVWGFESPPAHHHRHMHSPVRPGRLAEPQFLGTTLLERTMTVTVETLEKLERKITLSLPANVIQNEVANRLKRLARDVKMDGFRPGKVPMNVVAQRYGYSVHYEVMNDKVGEAFATA